MKCKVEECKKPGFRRGFCRKHYIEALGKRCSIKGCKGYARSQGLCSKHYAKFLKYGDPTVVKLRQLHGLSIKDRFNANIGKLRKNGCIYWNGYRDPNGYGRMNIDGKPIPAHRISWKINKGEIPDGLHVLHRCDNPPCVNVDHLFLGDQNDNNQDCIVKGRARHFAHHGEKHGCAKLTNDDILEIRVSNLNGVQLAEKFNVSTSNICDIRKRKIWTHI